MKHAGRLPKASALLDSSLHIPLQLPIHFSIPFIAKLPEGLSLFGLCSFSLNQLSQHCIPIPCQDSSAGVTAVPKPEMLIHSSRSFLKHLDLAPRTPLPPSLPCPPQTCCVLFIFTSKSWSVSELSSRTTSLYFTYTDAPMNFIQVPRL